MGVLLIIENLSFIQFGIICHHNFIRRINRIKTSRIIINLELIHPKIKRIKNAINPLIPISFLVTIPFLVAISFLVTLTIPKII